MLDVVYDPRPSMLLSAFSQYGLAIGGEEMLLYQALEQVKLMTSAYRNSKENFANCFANCGENCFANASKKDSDKATDYDKLSSYMRKELEEAL